MRLVPTNYISCNTWRMPRGKQTLYIEGNSFPLYTTLTEVLCMIRIWRIFELKSLLTLKPRIVISKKFVYIAGFLIVSLFHRHEYT